jgi:hypothetical protein
VEVDVMRQLERRLEAVIERAAGQFFRGTPHVAELAGSIVRVLDLSVDSNGLVPNRILVPAQNTVAPESISALENAITFAVAERGWRLEGPVTVVPSEVRSTTVTVEPGPLPVWGVLRGSDEQALRLNRAVIGRSSSCDVVLDHPSVSRRHAMLWCQDERVLCVDLGSSNGTTVDSAPVGSAPVSVEEGSRLTFGSARYRFHRTARA